MGGMIKRVTFQSGLHGPDSILYPVWKGDLQRRTTYRGRDDWVFSREVLASSVIIQKAHRAYLHVCLQ